ncbi:MAG: TAT-variant-translocated molybdopterin oxidoreductase [Planctomycetota bacterium]
MSQLDQCPSSKKQGKPVEKASAARNVSRASGKAYWRSLDDLASTREFKDFVQREFPAHASELLDSTRRSFLKIMGASFALAGAGSLVGCRRPDHRLVAYNDAPEDIIPGKALYYATALPVAGGSAVGVLAETHTGRPTKLEGNPLHPVSRGRSDSRMQAVILSLYDPDRDPSVIDNEFPFDEPFAFTGWTAFWSEANPHFESYNGSNGRGLAFLVNKATSPSRDRMRDEIMRRYPRAQWLAYDPADNEAALGATARTLGSPHKVLHRFDRAQVVVSIDDDFLGGADSTLPDLRGWAQARIRPGESSETEAAGTRMSRLYVAEASMTVTGGQADHRIAHKPGELALLTIALCDRVLELLDDRLVSYNRLRVACRPLLENASAETLPREWIDAAARDLIGEAATGGATGRNRGRSLLLVGATMPESVHAAVMAVNQALGNVGKTVEYMPLTGDVAQRSRASLGALAAGLETGDVTTLVTIDCNPAYDAPADLALSEKIAGVGMHVHLGEVNETAVLADHALAIAHPLESWGDVETWDGTYSVTQPMIEPLFGGKTAIEFLAVLAGMDEQGSDPYEVVRGTFRSRLASGASGNFEKVWRKTLHNGVLAASMNSVRRRPASDVNFDGATDAILTGGGMIDPSSSGIEVVFAPCSKVRVGAEANNGWLQELPHAVTKVVWDNPMLVSRKTAERLGLRTSRHLKGPQYNHVERVTLTLDGRTMDVPIWVQPGLADDVAILHMGYGREVCGRIGRGTGYDANAVRSMGAWSVGANASIEPSSNGGPLMVASTQDHWSMEGRAIVREADLPQWQAFGDEEFKRKDAYYNKVDGNFAAKLGMEGHTPANRKIYADDHQKDWGTSGKTDLSFTKIGEDGKPVLTDDGRPMAMENVHGKRYQQWGMTVDLSTCAGCGACTIACQAENNIPIIGKVEVAKGREMHWMRVDRYYSSEKMDESAFDEPDMTVMPVSCVHCEAAPCEVVCPVNATAHSEHGLNEMAYNRCIGTRYCSNNCPYKVRRFNWFDYATKQILGGFGQLAEGIPGTPGEVINENLIPPRLREKKKEVATMQYNPNVTVRSRGVMEKCTYCIQRINEAQVEVKINGMSHIPDGFLGVACEQACPTGSIIFGDIYDNDANDGAGSRVQQSRNSGRAYGLLSYLNTRPRTSHLLRLRNPNPALVSDARKDAWTHKPGDHGGHSDEHDGEKHSMLDEGIKVRLPVLAMNGASA